MSEVAIGRPLSELDLRYELRLQQLSERVAHFQDVLRVLHIRPRPFNNARHTYISVALTLGCNQKSIAEQTGTSIAMIQQNYGRYIRDEGDRLLRDYVESTKLSEQNAESETLSENFFE